MKILLSRSENKFIYVAFQTDIPIKISIYGFRDSPSVICDKIDRVTSQDIMDLARRYASGPGPAVSVIGHDTSHMISYPVIKAFTKEYHSRFR